MAFACCGHRNARLVSIFPEPRIPTPVIACRWEFSISSGAGTKTTGGPTQKDGVAPGFCGRRPINYRNRRGVWNAQSRKGPTASESRTRSLWQRRLFTNCSLPYMVGRQIPDWVLPSSARMRFQFGGSIARDERLARSKAPGGVVQLHDKRLFAIDNGESPGRPGCVRCTQLD